jgi:DNA repair protein RecO (recombination protein O)
MQIQSSDAIVLRTLDYGESDRIATFLTAEHGIFKGFARAARKSKKRFGASLQSGAQVRLFWRPARTGTLASLQEVELIDLRAGLRRDLLAIALAGYACELVENLLVEGQEHAAVYELLCALLDHLERSGGSPEVRLLFELRLLHLSGYIPHLLHCGECGGPLPGDLAGFSAERGGSLCVGCLRGAKVLEVYPPTLGTLGRCLRTAPQLFDGFRFSARTVAEATAILGDALRPHLLRPLKSLAFLEQMLAAPAAANAE